MASEDGSDDLLRVVVIVLAVLILLPTVMMVLSAPLMGSWMLGWGMAGDAASIMVLVMMLGWVVVLALIGYVLYRAVGGRATLFGSGDSAIEELRRAYARGELSEEEFENRRAKLEDDDQ